MKISLYDTQKRKDIELNLTPEYSVAVSDLYVVFITKNFVTEFDNNEKSRPYNEYHFKKVSHIVSANISYEGDEYCLTIGYHLSSNNLIPFLINGLSKNGMSSFVTSVEEYNDNYSKDTILFNYKEYSELMELGLEKLTIKEYVKKLIDDKITRAQYELYTIPNVGLNDFLSKKGLDVFLEEEKKKKGK